VFSLVGFIFWQLEPPWSRDRLMLQVVGVFSALFVIASLLCVIFGE